jgi:hypothetical protein
MSRHGKRQSGDGISVDAKLELSYMRDLKVREAIEVGLIWMRSAGIHVKRADDAQ